MPTVVAFSDSRPAANPMILQRTEAGRSSQRSRASRKGSDPRKRPSLRADRRCFPASGSGPAIPSRARRPQASAAFRHQSCGGDPAMAIGTGELFRGDTAASAVASSPRIDWTRCEPVVALGASPIAITSTATPGSFSASFVASGTVVVACLDRALQHADLAELLEVSPPSFGLRLEVRLVAGRHRQLSVR